MLLITQENGYGSSPKRNITSQQFLVPEPVMYILAKVNLYPIFSENLGILINCPNKIVLLIEPVH